MHSVTHKLLFSWSVVQKATEFMLCVCMCVCVTSVRVNPHTEHIILTGHDRLVRAVSFLFCYVYTPWFHKRVLEGSRRACVSSSLPDGKSFLNHIKEFLSRNWAPKLKVSRSFLLGFDGRIQQWV